jgi:hypothetical protein
MTTLNFHFHFLLTIKVGQQMFIPGVIEAIIVGDVIELLLYLMIYLFVIHFLFIYLFLRSLNGVYPVRTLQQVPGASKGYGFPCLQPHPIPVCDIH